MGLAISGPDSGPFPRPITLALICDGGPTCGAVPDSLFPQAQASFKHPDGFIGARATATAAGWLERQAAQGRIFICPDCVAAGRLPRGAEPCD
jgi:hypothetical protein